MRLSLLPIFVTIFLTSCVDLYEPEYWRDGVYSVSNDPANASCKTLWRDVNDDGGMIGRVDCIIEVGSDSLFVIAKSSADKYWIINKQKDGRYLNANEVVQGPFTLTDFTKMKAKLGIAGLTFTKTFD